MARSDLLKSHARRTEGRMAERIGEGKPPWEITMAETRQTGTSNAKLEAEVPKLESMMPKLEAMMPKLEAMMPKLEAMMPKLEEVVPKLEAVVPKLEAMMPMLDAVEPMLEAVASKMSSKPTTLAHFEDLKTNLGPSLRG